MQMPRTKPIRKPPICEKLSSPGRRPKPNEITTSKPMNANSFPGDLCSFQEYSRSSKVKARTPKSDPEAPVDAMPLAAKFPPNTNPKMPLLK